MSAARFERVAPVVSFPELEAGVRRFWEDEQVFRRVVERRRGGPRWVFYEGPPTANGLPHNGHVLTRVIKDLFIRYRTMRGHHVPRKAGWDTHGLPVEIEVEKELGISGKKAVEAYGVEPFTRRCLASVHRYIGEWRRFSDQIGFWLDYDDHYATYQESYVESVWWALAELHRRDRLYRGHKIVWWWARGGTALSAAEVGEGYRSVDDPSIYVRLPLEDEPETSLLVWTTTPWTLPSNSFVAVRSDVEYAVVRDGGQSLVVAAERLPALAEKVGRELPVSRRLRGGELLGRRYRPPFDWYRRAAHPGLWRVVEGEFVELSTGTGLVHEAPAFGEVDFELLSRLRREDPELPLLCAVLPDGSFDPEVAPARYTGRFVKDCDRDLTRELRERELLWHAERYRHEYPFCPRADQDPLIQYARPAWYVRTSEHVSEALENNARIRWVPEHIREGRFGDFLRNNVDWALSRERYWGTPLNVWVNDETGAVDVPESVTGILERNPQAFEAFDQARERDPSLPGFLRVHRPWIDQVTWQRPGEPGTWRRVPEVIDAWFDSGAMPFAQWGHPHRGREEFERNFPADFISEAIDQTRGWFNSLLWISTLLFDDAEKPHPYRTCVVLGHVCDREGKKESKSKGNYTPPEVILERVRLEFALSESAKDGPGPPAGEAWIAAADYEGLDLPGGEAQVRAYRADRPEEATSLRLRPSKHVGARRRVALHAQDRARLGVEPHPQHAALVPSQVPGLAAEHKIFLEDPRASAPGADAFRWFFCSATQVWSPTRHSLGGVRASQRELPLRLRNVYAFFTIYANIDGFDPADPACREGRRPARERTLLDRWILSELAIATGQVREHLDAYRAYEATGVLTDLVESLSNWYVRRSRDRFWAPGLGADKLDAHWTLYECLIALAGLVAPFLPYTAESMWQNLWRRPFPESDLRSVHESDYPEPEAASVDAELSRVMRRVRALVSLGLQVRTAEKLRVRQPLQAAEIVLAEPELAPAVREHEDLIRDELNVQELRFLPKADERVRYRVKPDFRALGPRLGPRMPAVKRALAEADAAGLLRELEETGRARVALDGEEVELDPDEVQVSLEALPGYAAAGGPAGVVVLHTRLTPDLVDEGLFREVLNRVQSFRKELDLEYTERIQLWLSGSERLLGVVEPRSGHLAREALAVDIRVGEAVPPEAHARDVEIDGERLTLALRQV